VRRTHHKQYDRTERRLDQSRSWREMTHAGACLTQSPGALPVLRPVLGECSTVGVLACRLNPYKLLRSDTVTQISPMISPVNTTLRLVSNNKVRLGVNLNVSAIAESYPVYV
jgi:hypothetical protein